MSTDRDVTRIVRSWLEEGVTALPDRVLDSVLDQVPATSQRRARWPAWRLREMNTPIRIAVAVAAVALIAVVGITVLPAIGVGGPKPTPSPTPSPAASPAALPTDASSLPVGSYTTLPFAGSNVMGLCFDPPQSGCTESAADDSIRVTLSIPDGWASIGGTIWRAKEHDGPPGGAGLGFGRGGWVWSDLCNSAGQPDTPTGTSVDEFVTALVNHPALHVTSPVDVTLAGYSGKYLEIQMPANVAVEGRSPGPGETCGPFVWEPGIYAQGPNQLWHIWVLDVGGVRVVVRSDTYPGTTPQVQAELQAIVDLIKIEP